MGKETEISWTDATFNPWWGCVKVSAGCTNCYANAFDKRVGGNHWGPNSERRFFGEKHWAEPLAWNREAERIGIRKRVFCASMADVFEDREDLLKERTRLFDLIRSTPMLDWQLLTKRPENIMPLIDGACRIACELGDSDLAAWLGAWLDGSPPDNVWMGTTVENQEAADKRIPILLQVSTVVRFLSCEPLLSPVSLAGFLRIREMWSELRIPGTLDYAEVPGTRHWERVKWGLGEYGIPEPHGIDWVLVGAESGGKRRPMELEWLTDIVAQCQAAGVAVHVKQDSAQKSGQQGRIPDDLWALKQFPTPALVEAI